LLAAEFNPRIVAALAGLAERWRDEDDLLEAEAGKRADAFGRGPHLPCTVGTLPAALGRRVVRRWLMDHGVRGLTAPHVERVLRAAAPTSRGVVTLPGPWQVTRQGDVLLCRAGHGPPPAAFSEPLAPGGVARVGAWHITAGLPRPWASTDSPLRAADTAIVDVDALPGPLAVRSLARGDRVRVVGVGTRKLHDVLVDRKVPRERRAALAILVAGDSIVWVPGVIRTAVARVRDETRRVLEVRFENDDKVALPLTKSCGTFERRSERT
jgi:tRNA(Ile)-lysidine synthase